jgi:hypothetical protein
VIGFKNRDYLQAEAWALTLYRTLQAVANHPSKSWTPLLPLIEQDRTFLPGLAPQERTALAMFHREKQQLTSALGNSEKPDAADQRAKRDSGRKAAQEKKKVEKADAARTAAAAAGKGGARVPP